MGPALTRRAQELAEAGEPHARATVVRAQRPTSAEAGDTALVLADGTIEGFVGGDCAEHSVRVYGAQGDRDAASRSCCGSCPSPTARTRR